MALNNFTVFGINQAVYSTKDTNTTRKDLFEKGLEAYTTAKSNDVNTVLKETSLVTVAVLEWIKDNAVLNFDTPAENQVSVDDFITNVNVSLNSKIKELVEAYIPKITTTNRGGAKLLTNDLQTVTPNDITTTQSRSYAVQLNANEQLVVNVPWTDTKYDAGTGISLGTGNKFNINLGYVTSGKNYAVQNGTGGLFVSIPWTDTTAVTSSNSTSTDEKISYFLNAESDNIKTAKYTKFEVSGPLKKTLTAGVMTLSTDLVTASTSGIVPSPSSATNVILGVGGTVGSPSWIKVNKDMLSATGTPSASTFYRGDGSWATPDNTVYTAGSGISVEGSNKFILDTTYIGSIKKTTGTEKFVREDGSLVVPPMNTGPAGTAAGFGTPTASVDDNTGTPSVTVTATGLDTSKIFSFDFKNLKGAKGDDGVGIDSTSVTYQVSSSGTNIPTGAWVTAVPTVDKGKFLWSKTNTNYTNNTSAIVYNVAYQGIDGTNGRGIASTSITYQSSYSGVTIPTGTWNTNVPSINKGQYLWTRTVINYTDSKTDTSYSVSYQGTDGTNGTAAGFGTPTISATSLPAGSTPTASVTSSGTNTSKVFSFALGIPKGDKGDPGVTFSYSNGVLTITKN